MINLSLAFGDRLSYEYYGIKGTNFFKIIGYRLIKYLVGKPYNINTYRELIFQCQILGCV